MEVFLFLLLSLIAGYILGSFNMSIIIANLFGENIRAKGSGNAGLTNTLRVIGPRAGVIVFAGDVLKGVLACLIGYLLTAGKTGSERLINLESPNIGLLLAGTGCVFGHVFPVFFQFKGGKGVLTAATVVFMMDWRAGAILLCLFVITVLITGYVSAGSLLAAAGMPILCVIMGKPGYTTVYTLSIALLIIIMHRTNIGRLLSKTETKFKWGR